MKEKLEILEKEIRKVLPRLLELSMGCKLWKDGYFYTYIGKLIPEIDVRYTNPYHLHHFYSEEFIKDKKETFLYAIGDNKFKNYKIIGHDILLSDVLEWLKELELSDKIGTFEIGFTPMGRFAIKQKETIVFWDLSKPYLKDQSEKLIEFLYNLIEK